MSDIYTKEKRSEIMSQVKGRNTKPELAVRKLLHRMGFRFRLHDKRLPGTPDIVLPRHKRIILVHGCFWHGHEGCNRAKLPTANAEFWQSKISGNLCRDSRNIAEMKKLGWQVLVIWTCEIRKVESLQTKLRDFFYGDT